MIEKPRNNFVNWKSFIGIISVGVVTLIAIIGFINNNVSANQESTRINEVSIKGVETNIENIKDDIGEIKKSVDYIKKVFDK